MTSRRHRRKAESKKRRSRDRSEVNLKDRSHPYISLLLKPRRNSTRYLAPPANIDDLKAETPALIHYVLQQITRIPSARNQWLGTIAPQSFSGFDPRMPTPPSDSLATEINWATAVLSEFTGQINAFVSLSTDFTRSVLVGDLDAAESALNDTNINVGFSLWSIESALLLAELKGGIEENRSVFTSIRSDTTDVYAQLIAQFASNRAEQHLSMTAYRATTEEFFKELSSRATDSELLSYLRFKSDPFASPLLGDDTLIYFLAIENTYSLVDRYVLLLRIAQLLVATRPFDECCTLLSPIPSLSRNIPDLRLARLAEFLSRQPATPTTTLMPPTTFLHVVEDYTAGRYSEVADSTAHLLPQYPLCFELYDLHTKAAAQSGTQPAAPFPVHSIAAALLERSFNIVMRTPATDDALDFVEKWASLTYWSPLGPQLFAYHAANSSRIRSNSPAALRELNSSVLSERFCSAYGRTTDALAFLDNWQNEAPGRMSTYIMRRAYGQDHAKVPSAWTGIPTEREVRYSALSLERHGRHAEADILYSQLLSANAGPVTRADAILGRVRCLLAQQQVKDCADLFLSAYFTSRELLAHIPLHDIIKAFEALGSDAYSCDVIWPILYHIYYTENDLPQDDKRLFVLTDNWLRHEGVDRPSALLDRFARRNDTWLVYMLRYVCVPEVISWLFAFERIDDVEVERMSLCQHLRDIDPDSRQDYTLEISRIATARFVRDAVHSVDSSKIYVDTAGIRRSIDRAFIEKFDRFRAVHGLDSRIRETVMEVTALGGKRLAMRETVVVVDAVVEMFNSLFIELGEKYLTSSAYGLDSYLSLRIRHGTLAGQLRALFERRNLLTTADEITEQYQPNLFWRDKLSFARTSEIDAAFARFSRTVDEHIRLVNNQWMQLADDTRPDGLFDFRYDQRGLALVYERLGMIDSLDDFVDGALAELRARTESNLERVRSAIQGQLRDMFIDALNTLEFSLVESDGRIRSTELPSVIAQCRTDVQVEINHISSWFDNVGDTPIHSFTLRQLIDTVIEIVHRSRSTSAIPIVICATGDVTCDGKAFTHLVDVFVNLLDNAVANADVGHPEIRIEVVVIGSDVTVRIKNQLSASRRAEDVEGLILELKKRLTANPAEPSVRGEGGSGYFKLAKLCSVDLKHIGLRLEPSCESENDALVFVAKVDFAPDAVCHENRDN